jgi:primary-amine oxidase
MSFRAFALSPAVHHPLDGLTPDEYWTIYNTLRDEGKLTETTVFASVLLHEPVKSEVLAWKAGSPIVRRADVVLLTAGKSYEVLVNITAKKTESYKELENLQAPVSQGEMHGFDDMLKHDPRIVEALKKPAMWPSPSRWKGVALDGADAHISPTPCLPGTARFPASSSS